MANSADRDVDGRVLDGRVPLMARAMARKLYPTITEEELNQPAKRWNGTALGDAECTVWQDHVPQAEAALEALQAAHYIHERAVVPRINYSSGYTYLLPTGDWIAVWTTTSLVEGPFQSEDSAASCFLA